MVFTCCKKSLEAFQADAAHQQELEAVAQHELNARRRKFAGTMGLPAGIQNELVGATEAFPVRYYICDNSGSMMTNDGHRFIRSTHAANSNATAGRGFTREGLVSCSRWKELVQTLRWVGETAIGLEAPTHLLLLNSLPGVGSNSNGVVTLGNGRRFEEKRALEQLLASSPRGGTPICERIRRVVQMVRSQEQALRSKGQRAVVTIATDGISTDGDVAAALKPLESLPVWVVIKLCTDDDDVVGYWNEVDGELELDMDVLDDLCGEAKEVTTVNPWLTYGLELHRLREWGSPHKLLDMLDEVQFSSDQAAELMSLILGAEATVAIRDCPLELDPRGFAAALEQAQQPSRVPAVWCPLKQRRTAWFDPARLPAVQGLGLSHIGMGMGMGMADPAASGTAGQQHSHTQQNDVRLDIHAASAPQQAQKLPMAMPVSRSA